MRRDSPRGLQYQPRVCFISEIELRLTRWLASTTLTEVRQLHLPIVIPELKTDPGLVRTQEGT
jgi:hypothetical protein